MTIKDEILEELWKKTPLVEIKRKYRSQSQLYEALRDFLEEADKIVKGERERLGKVGGELFEGQTELQRVTTQRKEVSEEIKVLRQEKEKLSTEVSHASEELNRLRTDIAEVQSRGFTSEILNKIKTIEDRSGPELLLQVENVEKYNQVQKEFSCLAQKKSSLDRQVQALETRKKKIEERMVSEKNRLDELKLRTATFREAVDTVYSLVEDGYCTEDIKSLKHGLDALGIKGDPLLSITRLVNGLKKQKTLVALEERLVETEKKLVTLKKALADAERELSVAEQVTLKAIEEAKNAGIKAIANTAELAQNTTKSTATKFETQAIESLGKIDAHMSQTMEGLRAGLGEWGELQKQKGKLEEIIHPSLVFMGILKSNEYLKKVSLSLVAQLFDRLHLWSEMNLQDATVKPSENIHKKEYTLKTWDSYKLSVLIELVSEGLKQLMIQQSR